MPSYKRFRLFWTFAPRERHPRFHATHMSDESRTLCGNETEGMSTDGKEYQLPPPKLNCFKCLKRVKNYWPEKGSYYVDGLNR